MTHRPISIQTLGLYFPQKVCFTNFSTTIHYGMRIGIIGHNGSGKTTFLKMLQGLLEPSQGHIHLPEDVSFGYVPQVIEEFEQLSGGQRLNEALSLALGVAPNVLLLDEPTNHLDARNRRSLMRLLRKFPGTLIVISHDVECLRTCVDILWHIDQGKVTQFTGNYNDYIQEISQKRNAIQDELRLLDRQKKQTHKDLMREQVRAKKSKVKGAKKRAQGRWPTIVAGDKERQAQETTGRHNSYIITKKQDLIGRLDALRLPEIIIPTFSLKTSEVSPSKTMICVRDGSCGYGAPLLGGIFLSLGACGRLAITGDNGAGKSTLVRAILNDGFVTKSGEWVVPKRDDIGYLDQHYSTLNPQKTVLETIQEVVPEWSHRDVRRHLNDFLFRSNEEVGALVSTLSGGEKARLCLGQIAVKTPKLLILDEMTNNLDLETRAHVIQVLKSYPGAIIVISHDADFLNDVGVYDFYDLPLRKEQQ